MVPKEFHIWGVYFPPLLIVMAMALVAAYATARALNAWRLSRFFVLPRLVLLSLIALYAVLFGTFIIRV